MSSIPERAEFGSLKSRIYSFLASRSERNMRVYRLIVERLQSLGPSSILEIGCGPGIVSCMVAEALPEAQMVCIDPSPSMIRIAEERGGRLSLLGRVTFRTGSAEAPGTSGTFDVIFSSLSFHHWADRDSDLASLASMLSHKGSILIFERLVGEGQEQKRRFHGHGVTEKYVTGADVPGCSKTFDISGRTVVLGFRKD